MITGGSEVYHSCVQAKVGLHPGQVASLLSPHRDKRWFTITPLANVELSTSHKKPPGLEPVISCLWGYSANHCTLTFWMLHIFICIPHQIKIMLHFAVNTGHLIKTHWVQYVFLRVTRKVSDGIARHIFTSDLSWPQRSRQEKGLAPGSIFHWPHKITPCFMYHKGSHLLFLKKGTIP